MDAARLGLRHHPDHAEAQPELVGEDLQHRRLVLVDRRDLGRFGIRVRTRCRRVDHADGAPEHRDRHAHRGLDVIAAALQPRAGVHLGRVGEHLQVAAPGGDAFVRRRHRARRRFGGGRHRDAFEMRAAVVGEQHLARMVGRDPLQRFLGEAQRQRFRRRHLQGVRQAGREVAGAGLDRRVPFGREALGGLAEVLALGPVGDEPQQRRAQRDGQHDLEEEAGEAVDRVGQRERDELGDAGARRSRARSHPARHRAIRRRCCGVWRSRSSSVTTTSVTEESSARPPRP